MLVAEEDILMAVEVEVMEEGEDPTRMDALDIMTSQETIIRGTTTMVEEEEVVGVVVDTLTTVMVPPKVLLTLQVLEWLRDITDDVLGVFVRSGWAMRMNVCCFSFIFLSLSGRWSSSNSPSNILLFL